MHRKITPFTNRKGVCRTVAVTRLPCTSEFGFSLWAGERINLLLLYWGNLKCVIFIHCQWIRSTIHTNWYWSNSSDHDYHDGCGNYRKCINNYCDILLQYIKVSFILLYNYSTITFSRARVIWRPKGAWRSVLDTPDFEINPSKRDTNSCQTVTLPVSTWLAGPPRGGRGIIFPLWKICKAKVRSF